MVLFGLEGSLRHEHGEVGVLHPNPFDFAVEGLLDDLPDFVGPGPQDVAPGHVVVLDHLRLDDYLLVPLRKVLLLLKLQLELGLVLVLLLLLALLLALLLVLLLLDLLLLLVLLRLGPLEVQHCHLHSQLLNPGQHVLLAHFHCRCVFNRVEGPELLGLKLFVHH